MSYGTGLDEPAHGIAAYAEANVFDLIILPSHGRTGFKLLLIGLTAERVAKLAHCPVMVLRSVAEVARLWTPFRGSSPFSGENRLQNR